MVRMYVSMFAAVVLLMVFLWLAGSSKRHAVITAVAVTADAQQRALENVLAPLQEVLAAAWLEAARWRSQLESRGETPRTDPTLLAFAQRAAERFAHLTGNDLDEAHTTVNDLLRELLGDDLEHVRDLASDDGQDVSPARRAPPPVESTAARIETPKPKVESTNPMLPTPQPLEHIDDVLLGLGLSDAASIFNAAQERHFAKKFGEARYLYAVVDARYPTTKQAIAARAQEENLKGTAMVAPGFAIVASRPPPQETAAASLRQASELHFSKRFDEACDAYEGLVARWPDSDEARKAREQLRNLGRKPRH